MTASIVLIGPSRAGKTTLSKLLAEALHRTAIDLDDLRFGYYEQIGYSDARAKELLRQGGLLARSVYWKPFEVYSVECVLRDFPENHIIAFGASNSVYDDAAQFQRVKTALAPFPQVILVQHAPDVEDSVQVMHQRLREAEPDMPEDFANAVTSLNRYFTAHPSNNRLATMTVYTAGKTPAAACTEIVQQLRPQS